MNTLAIDIETYSSTDLIKCGVYKYAEDPTFSILLLAYAWNDEPVQILDIENGSGFQQIESALVDPNVLKTAFNANFERTCLSRFLDIPMPAEQWQCTAVHAATLGLPRSLAEVAKVLKLDDDKQKMKEGKALINYFCKPCNPTARNGGRMRNRASDDLEKWEVFKNYCIHDVEVERAVRSKLSAFPVTEREQDIWQLDQKINDRGVLVDRDLVDKAIKMADKISSDLKQEAIALTGLDNPSSIKQLKDWLEQEDGIEVESLNKKVIPGLLEETNSELVKRVLQIRQGLGKTSISKYQALARAMNDDDRLRGSMLFYGARTGRWAGRIFQPQNLVQNKLKDLALARKLVQERRMDDIDLLFDSIPDTLSQLIRTALIPAPGCSFIVADFSAIEARVLAWLAGESWKLDVFNGHGRIYEATAAKMFKINVESIKKGNPEYALRAKGKVADLACIAKGQLVMTNSGLIPIEDIKITDLVWDGVEFVKHQGVIAKGKRDVITYEGLTATKDHLVWVEGEPEPLPFGEAAACGAHLAQSGYTRCSIRPGGHNQHRKTLERKMESLLCIGKMRRLRKRRMGELRESKIWKIKRLPKMLETEKNTKMVGSQIYSSETEMHQSKRRRVQKLRRSWHRIQIHVCARSRIVDDRKVWCAKSRYGVGQDKYEWPLRARKFKMGDTPRKLQKSAQVYDILNVGTLNRYTVSGVLVHNCGYGGSVGALKAMGALAMGLDENELPCIVSAWRKASPATVKLWGDIGKAAIRAVKSGIASSLYGLKIYCESGFLFIRLPSGRALSYPKPRIGINKFGSESLQFDGINQGRKIWGLIDTYGPKLVENIVQAISRDLLAEAMLNLERAGYNIVMHIHDEVIIEKKKAYISLDGVLNIMGKVPAWAKGLPQRADGYECEYYRKE